MKHLAGLAAVLVLSSFVPAQAEQENRAAVEPVVVELFTSQGCSSCPPADALLKQIAQRPEVLALAMHVDYWDYIGWKDSFASPVHTNRQKGYAQIGGRRMIYTPQMIVMGQQDVSGRDAMALADAISSYQDSPRPVDLEVVEQAGQIKIRLSAREELGGVPVTVQILRYTPLQSVAISRGELAGHELDYANVVSDLAQVGVWDGQDDKEITVEYAGDLPGAVLVQHGPFGPILAAARIP